jgi:phytoene dehydrogenase-like protein
VVGAGHNGLVAACYLARAGRDVVVLEALDRPGGGARTEQTVPGFRFDLHSVAHNIINMTDILAELDLAGAGLVYQEMDPFSIAVRPDGRTVRFHRSVEQTVASIAEHDRRLADDYRQFVSDGTAVVRAVLPAMRGDRGARAALALIRGLGGMARAGPLRLARDLMAPYESTLHRRVGDDLVAGPIAAFAAHGGMGPTAAGGSLYVYWQAAYHLFGQWHARGGSQSLADALVARLRSLGGQMRCSAPVEAIETSAGRVTGVRLAGGERIAAATVTAAIDPKTALLGLLQPALAGPAGADLAATRRSNVVQAVIHVAARSLPVYPDARPGDWNGLQSYVDHVENLSRAWTRAEAGLLDDRPPLYAFTLSAIDETLAAAGQHTVYLACPAAPARVEGGWDVHVDRFVETCLHVVEQRAPGFRDSIIDLSVRTPETMQAEGWVAAHPMHLDLAPDQIGIFRPTPALSGWRTPITGLYITGAGTNPTGGIAGTPGRQAARTLLSDHHH